MSIMSIWTYKMDETEATRWYASDDLSSRIYQHELIRRVQRDAEANGCEAFKIFDDNNTIAAKRMAVM